jgi:hypothetical protein
MPSSNKTQHLNLNKWLGTDKPKKDDFNEDNQKVDSAWNTLNAAISTVQSAQSTHGGNGTIHVTAGERAAWNSKDKMTIGTYTGNGAGSRKITLGFRPRFGRLFAATAPPIKIDFDMYNCNMYTAYFSSSGCSEGLSVDDTGFTFAHHATTRPNGNTLKYNDPNYTYVYVAWA